MVEPLRLSVQHAGSRKKKRGPAKLEDFSIPGAIERADAILAGPCRGHLPRVAGKGRLIQRFVLPLDLCKTANALISMVGGRGFGAGKFGGAAKAAAYKAKVYKLLHLQHPFIRPEPLHGRPFIRAIRFSVKETDQESNGLKTAIDLLRVPKPGKWNPKKNDFDAGRKGLGFLVDDAPRFIELACWWEYAPPGRGMGLLEIYEGGT